MLSLVNLNLHAHDRIIQLIVVPEAHLLDYPIDSTGVLSHQNFHCSCNLILHFFGGTLHCQTLSNDQFIFELMCIKFKFVLLKKKVQVQCTGLGKEVDVVVIWLDLCPIITNEFIK